MIQIYYGYGKGKTTAALGAGLRAYGAGKRVVLVQFLKDNQSGELKAVPFDVFNAPDNLPFHPDKEYHQWVDSALDAVSHSDADVIILDEFLDVIPQFVSPEKAVKLVNLPDKEIIMTGHKTVEELFSLADYITYFEKIKHPYDNGVKARLGFEY